MQDPQTLIPLKARCVADLAAAMPVLRPRLDDIDTRLTEREAFMVTGIQFSPSVPEERAKKKKMFKNRRLNVMI